MKDTPLSSCPPVERRSPTLVRLFTQHYARRYLAKHFHGVWLSRSGQIPTLAPGPVVVLLNHPSWWDPLIGMVLADFFPERTHFVPIDARMLARYRFFARLGFYGVETGTLHGARAFLRDSVAILAHPGTALWITAQGQFTDARRRPPGLMSGVAHLIRRLERGSILPLALEYTFWNERPPEALARFGTVLPIEAGASRSADDWLRCLNDALASCQDVLASEAMQRNPELFHPLLAGKAGVGGIYDVWRRLKSWLRGERFHPEHEPPPARPARGTRS